MSRLSHSDWMADQRRRAVQAPLAPRVGWRIDGEECGSIEIPLAQRIALAGLPLRQDGEQWALTGPPDESLDALARWLHAEGLGGRWRDERLAVTSAADDVRAVVERAAVRTLGIATHAVHLVGTTHRASVWVQRRAMDKAVDPGLLDTLVGGLAAAGETTMQTLERETWEEAGLRLDELHRLAFFGRDTVRRPVSDGYMVEHIEMFEAEVPEGVVPANRDGEVMAFECLAPAELVEALRAQQFTFEATLIHLHWLERSGLI